MQNPIVPFISQGQVHEVGGRIYAAFLAGRSQHTRAMLFVGTIGYVIVASIVNLCRESVLDAKAKGEALRWKILLYPGVTGCILVYALAWFNAGTTKGKKFDAALDAIPYWGALFALVGFAFVFRFCESAPRWAPQVPGEISKVFEW